MEQDNLQKKYYEFQITELKNKIVDLKEEIEDITDEVEYLEKMLKDSYKIYGDIDEKYESLKQFIINNIKQ